MVQNKPFLFFFMFAFLLISCGDEFSGDDDSMDVEIVITVNDFETTIDENPQDGQVLGTIDATTNSGTLTFSIVSQSPSGAITINSGTGELSVLDATLFEFDDNSTIIAVIEIRNGGSTAEADVTINLNEVEDPVVIEVTIEDFEVTIDENPETNQVLGTVNATTNQGNLTFSIISETPVGALDIDSVSGQLTVLEASLFEFDNNPSITAVIEARNGDVAAEANVNITLTEVVEPDVIVTIEDFEVTIDENPEAGDVLGTINASTNIGEITYSVVSQIPTGAIAVDSMTGEISVLDASLFEFDDNPTITAVIEARNGDVAGEANVEITLREVSDSTAIIYDGPLLTFEKGELTDPSLEANQDRITDNVWITRNNNGGLYNRVVNTAFSQAQGSPVDTEWAEGTLEDRDNLTFTDWRTAVNANPPSSIGKTYVVHLITDNIFLEVTFLTWRGNNNGSFSYERTTPSN